MKKYLLGLFAIALAIGFSAFTSVNHKPVKQSTTANLYWYEVSAGQVVGSTFNPTAAEDRTTAISALYLGCDDSGAEVCLFGTGNASESTPFSLPGEPDEDAIIKVND